MKSARMMMWAGAALFVSIALTGAEQLATVDSPRFTENGKLMRPDGYREWVFLSSGLGMTYAAEGTSQRDDPHFDNVFVSRAAYQSFLKTGIWPDKTMLVLEVRNSRSKGSINQGGRFQSDLNAVEVEVKDTSRFAGKWAFFDFQKNQPSAKPLPRSAACYSCHAQNGAVDNTFVQFYPTLLDVARARGTLKAGARAE